MKDFLSIIFSLFDFSSEVSLRQKTTLNKKQKKVAYLLIAISLALPIIIILIIESKK